MPWPRFSHQSDKWIPLSPTEREERHVQNVFFILKMMELLCCLNCSHKQPFPKSLHSFICVLRQWLPLFNGATGTSTLWHLFSPHTSSAGLARLLPTVCREKPWESSGMLLQKLQKEKSTNQSVLLWSTSVMVCQAHYWFSDQNTNSALKLFQSMEGVQFFRRQLSSETLMDNKGLKKQILSHWLFLSHCSSAGPSSLAHPASRQFSSLFMTKCNSRGKWMCIEGLQPFWDHYCT